LCERGSVDGSVLTQNKIGTNKMENIILRDFRKVNKVWREKIYRNEFTIFVKRTQLRKLFYSANWLFYLAVVLFELRASPL
jgi:hypothetical protein